MFDRRQKFCEPAARLDGLAKLSSHSNGVEGQIGPELKRCGPTRVGADAKMHQSGATLVRIILLFRPCINIVDSGM